MNNRHYTIAAAALVIATAVHADHSSVAAKSTTSSSGGEATYRRSARDVTCQPAQAPKVPGTIQSWRAIRRSCPGNTLQSQY